MCLGNSKRLFDIRKALWYKKNVCVPKTFVNLQHENTNSKGDFVPKTGLKRSF